MHRNFLIPFGFCLFLFCVCAKESQILDSSNPEQYRYPAPFKSKLNATCDPSLFKEFSMFHLLSKKSSNTKMTNRKSLIDALKEIRHKMSTATDEEIEQTCVTRGQKAELLECIEDQKRCVCYETPGIWAALQLHEEKGACVSPNKAWCINWGNSLNMELSKCAGGGKCVPPKKSLPFLCAELDMGVCVDGTGPVAKTNLTKASKCYLATGRLASTSSILLVLLTQAAVGSLALSRL